MGSDTGLAMVTRREHQADQASRESSSSRAAAATYLRNVLHTADNANDAAEVSASVEQALFAFVQRPT